MTSLFTEISGGRPEHVAKGALVFLLRRDPALVAWIAAQCNRVVPSVQSPSIMPEVPVGDFGWRADVVIDWSDPKPLALELKLGAPFTPNQRAALAAGEVALVIAPARNLSNMVPSTTRVVLWADLLAQVTSTQHRVAAAVLLLHEAAESYGWYLERISSEDIHADAAAMFDEKIVAGRTLRDWSQSYRFIYQIDAHLEGLTPAGWRYLPSARNLAPNRKHSHYGYYFALGPSKRKAGLDEWWIGFNREAGKLALRLYRNETEIKREWPVDTELHAGNIAEQALLVMNQS